MATQQPISTISYNTETFLKEKLDSLYENHTIQAYQYIMHKGEDGDKDHIHLRIEPNKKLDPMDLLELFTEYVRDNDKPLRCRPFRKSKEEDWCLYAVHDSDYLAMKYGGGEEGEKLPYAWEDIKSSPMYDVEVMYIRAKASMKHSTPNLLKQIKSGVHPSALVGEGENPFMLNALVKLLDSTDYVKVVSELRETSMRLRELEVAMSRSGYKLDYDKDGQPIIVMGEVGIDTDVNFKGQQSMGLDTRSLRKSAPKK